MSRNKLIVIATLIASFFSFSTLQAAPVDINSADAQTLAASLNGIGMSKANAIVEYRTANGEFKSIADLSLVKGIGERTVYKNRDDIVLNAKQLSTKQSVSTDAVKAKIDKK